MRCSIADMTIGSSQDLSGLAPATGRRDRARAASRLLAGGGLLGALAASSCCLLPLLFFGLGISGAWIGNLTALAPYQPYFLAVAAVSLGAGYWRVWQSRQAACAADAVCARALSSRTLMASLVLATFLVIAAVALDLVAPFFVAS